MLTCALLCVRYNLTSLLMLDSQSGLLGLTIWTKSNTEDVAKPFPAWFKDIFSLTVKALSRLKVFFVISSDPSKSSTQNSADCNLAPDSVCAMRFVTMFPLHVKVVIAANDRNACLALVLLKY